MLTLLHEANSWRLLGEFALVGYIILTKNARVHCGAVGLFILSNPETNIHRCVTEREHCSRGGAYSHLRETLEYGQKIFAVNLLLHRIIAC